MMAHKVIGVLGGMGPAATVEFFRRLVESTPATIDQNHLRIVIDNDPTVPDRIQALLHGGPTPAPALARMAQRLQSVGAEVLTMPCNTAHAFLDAIRDAVDSAITIIDMIQETAARADVSAVGLLATGGTVATRIYHRALEERSIRVVVPSSGGQETVGRAIEAIKAGRSLGEVESAIARAVGRLKAQGAEAVIAGCTEISLLDGKRMPLPWIDSLDCLVDATIREACCGKGRP
jgi:aspartate racemase